MPDEQSAGSSTAVEEQPLSESAPEKQATEGNPTPAADSDPAKPKPRQRTPADSERRFRQLANENRELRDRLGKLEKPTQQAADPAPLDMPDLAEFSQHGDQAWSMWQKAVKAYVKDEVSRASTDAEKRALANFEKAATEKEQSRFYADISSKWNKQLEAERAADPDFDEIAFAEDLVITDSMLRYMVRQENVGGKILKWLGNHPDEAERISRLDNDSMVEALAEIKLTIGGKASGNKAAAPGRKLSTAPPPPNEVGGRNGVPATGDALMAALKRGDSAEYQRLYVEEKTREYNAKHK